MAGALGLRARMQSASAAQAFANAGLYHVGRLSGYALGGALAGAASATLQRLIDLSQVTALLRIASGALLLLVAVRILSTRNPLAGLERFGFRVWKLLRPLGQRSAACSSVTAALAIGLVWGWLPCGLTYSMLASQG